MRLPEEVAQSWLRKAEQESDPFDRFVSLWLGFNALYNQFFFGNERQAIKDFIYNERLTLNQFNDILNAPATRFFQTRIIRDCRSGTSRNTLEDATILKSSSSSYTRRLKALLMILYQVRCNLFHGNKMYDSESDREVVSNAESVLMLIIRAYLR